VTCESAGLAGDPAASTSAVSVIGKPLVMTDRPADEVALLASLTPLRDSTPLLDDHLRLQQRYAEDGFLLVRRLIPPRLYAPVFEEIATILQREGVAQRDRDGCLWWTGASRPQDAVWLSNIDSLKALVDVRIAGQRHPLQGAADLLLGRPAWISWDIGIMESYPTGRPATQIHQDRFGFGDAGDYRRFWMPMTPIPSGDGGLAIAAGSHRGGVRALRPIPLECVPEGMSTTAFEPGDALLLHADLIHATVPYTSNRVRLAMVVNVCADESPHPAIWFDRRPGAITPPRPGPSSQIDELIERQAAALDASAPRSAAILRGLTGRQWPTVPRNIGIFGWDWPLRVLAGLHYLALAGKVTWSEMDRFDFLDPSELFRSITFELARPDRIDDALALLPALLELGADRVDLIQLGTSSGLLTGLDRFEYSYGPRAWGRGGPVLGTGSAEPLTALLERPLRIVRRRAVGLHTVDISTDHGARLLQAFVLPDDARALAQLQAAIEVARDAPPELVRGDYVQLSPRLLSDRDPDALTVVLTVRSTVGLSEPRHRQLLSSLQRAGVDAPIALVSLEPARHDLHPGATTIDRHGDLALEVTRWPGGETRRLATLSRQSGQIRWEAG
jgi:hypothetical protein